MDTPHSLAPWRFFRYCIWDAEDFIVAALVCGPGQQNKFETNGRLMANSPRLLELSRALLAHDKPETRAELRRLIFEIDGLTQPTSLANMSREELDAHLLKIKEGGI